MTIISNTLTPNQLFDYLNENNINKFEAINILFSLIEECNAGETRANYVEIFDKMDLKSKKSFKFIENLLISDESPEVRIAAAKVIINTFPSEILNPLKWVIQNDNSVVVLRLLDNLIQSLNDQYNNTLRRELLKRYEEIASNYGVSLKEAEFLMDIGLNQGFYGDSHSNSLRNVIFRDNIIVIIKAKHIRAISLSSWSPASLPESIMNLEKLKYANLSCNELTILPKSMDLLTRLNYLDLGWNKFTSIPSFLAKVKLVKKIRLDLNHNEITSIPKWIRNLKSLNYLNLRDNKIQSIPDSIGYLKSMQYLDLRENQIEYIPDSIGLMSSLRVLWLNNNQITYIPNSIGSLKFLKVLDLGNNYIKEIPESLCKLKSLEYLNLRNNQIRELPHSIKSLKNLKKIRI